MNPLPINPAIACWNKRFDADPVQAIGNLLAGRVFLGPFTQARPDEALVQILTPEQIPLADQAVREWLAQVLGSPARAGLPGKQFADALVEAFRAVLLVPLPESRTWCAENGGRLRYLAARLLLRQHYGPGVRAAPRPDPEATESPIAQSVARVHPTRGGRG